MAMLAGCWHFLGWFSCYLFWATRAIVRAGGQRHGGLLPYCESYTRLEFGIGPEELVVGFWSIYLGLICIMAVAARLSNRTF